MDQATSMKFSLGSFSSGGGHPFLGLLLGDQVHGVADLVPDLGPDPSLLSLLKDWKRSMSKLEEAVAGGVSSLGTKVTDLRAHAPLPDARQVFCTGANYAKHVIQMMLSSGSRPEIEGMNPAEAMRFAEDFVDRQAKESNPFIFMKPVTAISGPYDDVHLPDYAQKPDWELELAVVFGSTVHRASREAAMSHVAGYMIVNDMTARDKVRRTDPGSIGSDWIAGKGAPGFLPSGPYFVPAKFVPDVQALWMRLSVNGQLKQNDTTGSMTFDIPRQIEFLSMFAMLLPGDILCTGTPAGNGVADGVFLKGGDLIEAEIDGLGRQEFRCVGPEPRG